MDVFSVTCKIFTNFNLLIKNKKRKEREGKKK